jgi:hypothetical protein
MAIPASRGDGAAETLSSRHVFHWPIGGKSILWASMVARAMPLPYPALGLKYFKAAQLEAAQRLSGQG